MKYEFSESSESVLSAVGWTLAVGWLLVFNVTDTPPAVRFAVIAAMLIIGTICLALLYHRRRWAQMVLLVTGINLVQRLRVRGRLSRVANRLEAAQRALASFDSVSDGRADLEQFYREIVRQVDGACELPTYAATVQNAQAHTIDRNTWERQRLRDGLAEGYDEGKMGYLSSGLAGPDWRPTWKHCVKNSVERLVADRRNEIHRLQSLIE